MKLTRRNIFPLAGAALLAGVARIEIGGPSPTSLPTSPRVRTLKNGWEEEDLIAAWDACGLGPSGKRVLVLTHLDTDPAIVAAVSRALRREGAAEVRIGAGPNLDRDAWAVAESAGYRNALDQFEQTFVDLNRDDVSPVEGLKGGTVYLPNTVLRADVMLSLAKADPGVVSNLSSMLPGAIYGWPKGQHSTAELARIFPRTFGVAQAGAALIVGETLAATDSAAHSV